MRLLVSGSVALLAGALVACGQPGASIVSGTAAPAPATLSPPTTAPVGSPAPTTVATAAGGVRADAEAACAEAFPEESRNGCITSYMELVETGSTMTPAEAEAYGFPYRVCVWPDGFWTLSPRPKSGTLPVGSLGCGKDGKAKVTAIVEAP